MSIQQDFNILNQTLFIHTKYLSEYKGFKFSIKEYEELSENELTIFRELSLSDYSGMNCLLDYFEKLDRKINAFFYLCYEEDKIIGWAIAAKETSSFIYEDKPFNQEKGYQFHVYIDRPYRQRGLGTKLLELSMNHINNLCEKIFVAPWNKVSDSFYGRYDLSKF